MKQAINIIIVMAILHFMFVLGILRATVNECRSLGHDGAIVSALLTQTCIAHTSTDTLEIPLQGARNAFRSN